MKGYYTSYGYKGFIPNKGYMLFKDEDEYEEYYNENKEDGNYDD